MRYKKIVCSNGWIVFIVNNNDVIQIHSTGLVTNGKDDRCSGPELITLLVKDAQNNKLHSQAPKQDGVRW